MKAPILVLSAVVIAFGIAIGGVAATEQTNDAPNRSVVEAVRVEGLRKTKESVVLDIVALDRGESVSTDEIQQIKDDLIKSDLFASVDVYFVPPGTAAPSVSDEEDDTPTVVPSPLPATGDLVIVVDEKWTLVPIPFFSSGGDGFSGGLILLESNLFGRNKQLITAAFGGTGGFSGFFLYADPAMWGSRWSSSLSGAVGRSDEETVRPDGEVIRSYTVDQQSAGLGIGYELLPGFRAGGRLGVSQWRIDDFSPGLDDTEIDDGSYLEPELRASYEDTRPVDVLLVGPEASFNARWVTLDEGWEVSGRATWGFPLFTTHRLRLIGSGGYGRMPAIAETPISARDGFRTLPYQATNADEWISGSVFYDFPIVSAGWGAFVLSHYWEIGAYDTDVIAAQPFYGPGGGFRIYIRQVAIPAVGLDVAYNIADPAWVFSFTVGAQM